MIATAFHHSNHRSTAPIAPRRIAPAPPRTWFPRPPALACGRLGGTPTPHSAKRGRIFGYLSMISDPPGNIFPKIWRGFALLGLGLIVGGAGSVGCSTTYATWYDYGRARWTASGERFDGRGMTAAHRSLPFGTVVRVWYGGRSVVVRVNDREPDNGVLCRVIDLTRGAARALGLERAGVGAVTVEVLGDE